MTKMMKTSRLYSAPDAPTGICPGCGYGIIKHILANVMEELQIDDRAIGVLGIGCSGFVSRNFDIDWLQAQHGRAPASATGIKRLLPDKVVFTFQGDGDLAAIGTAEIIHAAARNEKMTVLFVNNGIYGMTGGQMAPTTLENQVTVTSPFGRDPNTAGMPIKITEMISVLPIAYAARGAIFNPKEIRITEGYVKKAFEKQLNGEGFSMVEILSPCPTNWHMTPVSSMERIENEVVSYYPLGEMVTGKEGV
ncbi:thiamine pyrophosphate-dependent enzyme [Bacilliculturomica massiliensis]|uniref:thiamine pyrophosphate-dependent enzyme n=1 Tax=Bacilliculturomica massiliensis TaxID=1917867 RepID=UPI001A917618|nr:thiamine pyrophosphate-dependent enzyme [Bacilliculturomica massiliensis]